MERKKFMNCKSKSTEGALVVSNDMPPMCLPSRRVGHAGRGG